MYCKIVILLFLYYLSIRLVLPSVQIIVQDKFTQVFISNIHRYKVLSTSSNIRPINYTQNFMVLNKNYMYICTSIKMVNLSIINVDIVLRFSEVIYLMYNLCILYKKKKINKNYNKLGE